MRINFFKITNSNYYGCCILFVMCSRRYNTEPEPEKAAVDDVKPDAVKPESQTDTGPTENSGVPVKDENSIADDAKGKLLVCFIRNCH